MFYVALNVRDKLCVGFLLVLELFVLTISESTNELDCPAWPHLNQLKVIITMSYQILGDFRSNLYLNADQLSDSVNLLKVEALVFEMAAQLTPRNLPQLSRSEKTRVHLTCN